MLTPKKSTRQCQPDTSVTYTCPNAGDICTKFGQICLNPETTQNIVPACGDTSNCGKCEDATDGSFTCTSRTTYTMCMKNKLSELRFECPEFNMCDAGLAAEGQNPCVPECKERSISFCDLTKAIDAPETTTTEGIPEETTTPMEPTVPEITTEPSMPETTPAEPITTTSTEYPTEIPTTTTESTTTTTTTTTEVPTTEVPITTTTIYAPTPTTTPELTTTELPTTTENPADVLCSQQTAVGRYPYPNDNTCRRYVNCYIRGGVMQSTTMSCPGTLYFNAATTLCAEEKPEGCI
ncbi:uncharacterized protein LOC133331178 [Musca vetustissima]|uniref:uncharacterized protein LOC133331178 n=1 Tax=Musca vetustissima TaxID=27455 RepID=UPI002AB7493B|nr:uncharacterized protein LOC133331178 [Musca vetustissima]